VGIEQIDIRLIDIVDPDANPNLDFVLTDTARLIEQLRNEGRTLLLHCVACPSNVTAVLPNAWPNSDFIKAIERLAP
jgi:ADP-ribosyl-[dinitrogen reductase] hydrolase